MPLPTSIFSNHTTRGLCVALVAALLIGVLFVPASARAEDGAAVPPPTWTVPAGWEKSENQNAMRVATFKAGDGEVVVSSFPGTVGGLLANVNRWGGQVGLAPVTEDQLATVAQKFEAPGLVGHTMHLKGAQKHMLGAIIYETKADRSWFVKLAGPAAVADAQEAAFVAFAKSFAVGK